MIRYLLRRIGYGFLILIGVNLLFHFRKNGCFPGQ